MENRDVENALGLKQLKRDNMKYENSFQHSNFDLELYKDVVDLSPTLSDTIEEGTDKLKTFPNLSEDFFLSLYKFNPRLRSEDEVLPSRSFNYGLVRDLMETVEFQKLRKYCMLNMINTALGTESLHNHALIKINEVIEKYRKEREEAQINGTPVENLPPDMFEQIQKMAEIEAQNGQQQQNTNNDDPFDIFGGTAPGTSLPPEAVQQLAAIQQQISQDKTANQFKQDIKKAMAEGVQEALTDVHEMDRFIQQWGFEAGEDNRISADDCKRALERIRNSDALKRFSKILGRFRNIARAEMKKRSKEEGIALKNVEVGANIPKLLPTEKALLNNEATKPLFRKKYNERQLLQYQTESDKRQGMGPIIVCMDRSGSMSGNKITWAKAVSLALLEIALKQHRNYYFLSFTGYINDEYEILKGCANPNQIVDIAEIPASGGTDFKVPVSRSLDIIEKSKDFKKADITFITDGDCSLYGEVRERLEKIRNTKNVKVQTVLIDTGNYCDADVKNWSDSVRQVSKLADLTDDLAGDLFNFSIDDN